MHETALVQYTLASVNRKARASGIDKVTEIHLVIGKLRAAVPMAMQRAFSVLSRGTCSEGAALTVEERDIVLSCKLCGKVWAVDAIGQASCPGCGGHEADVISGNEMYIDYFTGTQVPREGRE